MSTETYIIKPFKVGTRHGYPILFGDVNGFNLFIIEGLNGLGQTKRITFERLSDATAWVDSQVRAYLGR